MLTYVLNNVKLHMTNFLLSQLMQELKYLKELSLSCNNVYGTTPFLNVDATTITTRTGATSLASMLIIIQIHVGYV